jgi:hypothetical protein
MNSTAITDVIKRNIAPILKDQAFIRKGKTWNRGAGQFIHVLDVQQNRSGALQFTLNVGIFSPKAFSICWGRPAPTFAKEWDCQLRRRAGSFLTLADSKLAVDYWWTFQTADDVRVVGEEVSALIRGRMLPYLSSITSLEDLRDGLVEYRSIRPWDTLYVIYLGIVTAMLGDVEGALRLLHELKDSAKGGWIDRIDHVIDKLHSPERSLA